MFVDVPSSPFNALTLHFFSSSPILYNGLNPRTEIDTQCSRTMNGVCNFKCKTNFLPVGYKSMAEVPASVKQSTCRPSPSGDVGESPPARIMIPKP